jgi:hypothetical protein
LIAFANQICFLSFSQYGIFFMDGICCCYWQYSILFLQVYQNSLHFACMAFADNICFLARNMEFSSCIGSLFLLLKILLQFLARFSKILEFCMHGICW